jgi:ribokinase
VNERGLVAVAGYTSLDRSFLAERLPRSGETSILTGQAVPPLRWGGCAPNVALWLRRLGVPVALVAWLGRDEGGRRYRDRLARAGVDLRGLAMGDGPTPRSVLVYTKDGEGSCLFHPSGADDQAFDVPDLVHEAGWVAITVGAAKLTRSLLEFVDRASSRERIRVAWDVKADRRAFPPDLVDRLARADFVHLNQSETVFVGDGLGLGRSAEPQDLLELGAGIVALTRGSAGATVVWPDGRRDLEAEPIPAPDPTGAGDAFMAGALAGLRGGDGPAEAAERGMGVAARFLRGEGREAAVPEGGS